MFLEKMKSKDVASTKTWKKDIFESVWVLGVHPTVCFPLRSQTPHCASHCGVNLRSELPTAESSYAVCITPLSQNAHRRVKIEIFTSLWVPLKGQSGEILLGVNNSIM